VQTAPYAYPPSYGQQPVPYSAAPQPVPYGAPLPPTVGQPQVLAPTPAPPPWPPASARPLLGPLMGSIAWQAESRAVAKELVANLGPQDQARVASIPLVFDPNPNEVNAFAGCDDGGSPFVAATEGLLDAIDAISQTKASDELYGTQTYEAYVGVIAPRLVTKDGGSALLPLGVVPPQYLIDPRRTSRAHEIFDEIVAFTFGHELSHHYLGHTGCANGQTGGIGPAIAQLGLLASSVLPLVNQPNEVAADASGCRNMLDSGLARAAYGYRWTEQGGLSLLDFFARLDRASGANPWLGFLRTHPNPGLRIPLLQVTAATWRFQHPG
jgi:Zn-dependent protease with chaperone function